jgi:chromosome segregation ATPase
LLLSQQLHDRANARFLDLEIGQTRHQRVLEGCKEAIKELKGRFEGHDGTIEELKGEFKELKGGVEDGKGRIEKLEKLIERMELSRNIVLDESSGGEVKGSEGLGGF